MNLAHRLLSVSLLALSLLAVTAAAAPVRPDIVDAYGKLPLRFERNDGQTDCEVEYLSRGRGSTLFLTRTEAVLALRGRDARDAKRAVLRLRMLGANAAPHVAGEEPLQGEMNYFIGNDRGRWRTGVPTYRRVRYEEVWPGIDMLWHGTRNALEYDFVVAPGVDPSRIALEVAGAERLRIDASGNLVAETAAGEVVQHAPVLYQESARGRTPVTGRYVLRGESEVRFEVGPYDRTRTLIIDPVLEYSTFLGGSSNDEAFGIDVDGQGNVYVTGPTDSADFPRADLLNDQTYAWLFVAKLNADGSDLIYSSVIGTNFLGEHVFEEGMDTLIATAIAVTADGKACITGAVDNALSEGEYPVTDNAFQGRGWCLGFFCEQPSRRIDAFVTVLSADGRQLVYSTYYGGEKWDPTDSFDRGNAIAVDNLGRVYIAGVTNSNDLPMESSFQKNRASSGDGFDAFVAVFDPSEPRGNDTLLYASFLGGSHDDHAFGIAVDNDRNAYVVGRTRSDDLKTKAPAGVPLQGSFQGGTTDGFVARIDTASEGDASLTYLTYFGGMGNDRVNAVAVDAFQRAYIAGATTSARPTFPLVNAFDVVQTNGEAFAAKLNGDGASLFYSSFLGGDNGLAEGDFEVATGIAVDAAGNAYVTGSTTAGDTFPAGTIEPSFPPELRGTAFVAKIGASSSTAAAPPLVYSTTFGGERARSRGIAVDPDGNAYITGFADDGLPTTPGAFQTISAGGRDAFVARIAVRARGEGGDTTGLYDSSRNDFHLRNANTTGGADLVVPFGEPGDLPVVGDWDADGVTDLGVFRPDGGAFLLRFASGSVAVVRSPAAAGDLPVAGDWDGDGFDTPGFYRNSGRAGSAFFLTNARVEDGTSPDFDLFVPAGEAGDLPLAGDWDGDDVDTVGFYRPSTTTFFQIDDFTAGVARTFVFGAPGDLPLAGDWDGNGFDEIGAFRPSDRTMHLVLAPGQTAPFSFELQAPGDTPVAGNWDGQ